MNLQSLPASGNSVTPGNDNFETLDWASVYGKDQTTTTALTWGYLGGRWGGFSITAGTLTLTNSVGSPTIFNYIVVARATGVISVSTASTNWDDTANYARVYKITAISNVVTAVEDHRAGRYGVHGTGVGSGDVVGPASSTDGVPALFDGTTGKLLKSAAIGFKVGSFTRDVSTASGSQAVTGVGFKPRAVIFLASLPSVTGGMSVGVDDDTTAGANRATTTAGQFDTATSFSIHIAHSGGNLYQGVISSLDSDGFTISWTKTGTPTGTATINYLALR